MDSMPVKEQEDEMARQFWGNNESDIASTLNKLLNGDEAFCNMYEELFTTEDENHRILKKQCHGGADLYRAGHHFTSDLLSLSAFTRHDGGNVTGKTLLAAGKLMLQNTKKAMAKMRYTLDETKDIQVADGFVSYTKHFKYLGSYISYNLRDDYDIDARLAAASASELKRKFGTVHIWIYTTNIYSSVPYQSTYFSGDVRLGR